MPFYNKSPVPVVPFAPNPGSGNIVVSVVTVGGLSIVKANVAANSTVNVLGAPAAGACYALKHFAGLAGGGFVTLNGITSGFEYSLLNPAPGSCSEHLGGALALEGLSFVNGGTTLVTVCLQFDVIEIAHIS